MPRTIADQIAERWPLHYQRIAEIVHDQMGELWFFAEDALPEDFADELLEELFVWGRTEEGYYYWEALAEGVASPDGEWYIDDGDLISPRGQPVAALFPSTTSSQASWLLEACELMQQMGRRKWPRGG